MRDYQTKSNVGGVADSISATRFGGGEFNSIAVELENAVSTSDQTLAPADGTGEVSNQLAMALAIYGAGGAQYMIDTGAANAYVLNPVSPKEAPPAYFDGFTATFEPGNVNTGASTVNINSIGAKSITLSDGTALSGGEIEKVTTIKYDLSNDRFEIISTLPATISVITASGNYSKPPGLLFAEVILVGGGGAGGGVDGQGAGTSASAGGGGGASFAIKKYSASELSSTEAVVIGAGGAGSTGSDGGSGGDSTFKSLTAYGGGGGLSGLASSAPNVIRGGNSTDAIGGDLNGSGTNGYNGISVSSTQTISGSGGISLLGGGGRSKTADGDGIDATTYGSGGGGATVSGVTDNYAGGDGADGVIIIKEFY